MTPNPNPSPELKPCPFCGSRPSIETEKRCHAIMCLNPDCGEVMTRWLMSADDAATAWNTRALSQPLPAPGEVEQSDWELAYSFTRKGHMRGSDGITVLANLVSEYRRTFLNVSAPSEQANGVGVTGACANCGNEGSPVKGPDKLHPYRVICKSCGAATAHHASWRASNDAWNRRPTLATVAAANDEGVAEAIEAAAKIADDLASIAERGKNHPQPLAIDTNEAWRRVEDACRDISAAIRLLSGEKA